MTTKEQTRAAEKFLQSLYIKLVSRSGQDIWTVNTPENVALLITFMTANDDYIAGGPRIRR